MSTYQEILNAAYAYIGDPSMDSSGKWTTTTNTSNTSTSGLYPNPPYGSNSYPSFNPYGEITGPTITTLNDRLERLEKILIALIPLMDKLDDTKSSAEKELLYGTLAELIKSKMEK